MSVLSLASEAHEVRAHGGGKGYHLHRLARAGLPVPSFAVISETVLAGFLRDNDLTEPVTARLAELTPENAERVAADLAALLAGGTLSEQLRTHVETAYRLAGGGAVAIRSSGSQEDGTQFSFAGQFDTFLDVRGLAAVTERVRQCWASAFSARSLLYRLRCGLRLRPDGVAVVVQRMVPADCSGVLFTADPLTGDTSRFVLTAGAGTGDGVVSGTTPTFTMDIPAADPGTAEPPAGSAIDHEAVLRLHALGRRITELSGSPQDVEWAVADGEVWVLQARPITAAPAATESRDGTLIWDNSNIIESFSGIVSPLTYTFAAEAYGLVYREYARSLRVPRRRLEQMDDWLPDMLGYFHGRVYYNLLHWYRMVRLAPLYPLSRRVLEVSLGVEEPLDDETANALHPYTSGSWSRAVTVATYLYRFATTHRAVDRFINRFYPAFQVFDVVDYDALAPDEVYRRFRRLERDLIAKWGPMMVLDAALLHSFGILALLTKRWLPDAPEWFVPAIASPGEQVESIEPVRAMTRLAELVRADPCATELLERLPPGEIYDALRASAGPEVVTAVDDYLDRYGYRSVDELKLEVPDLRQRPADLFVMLRAALAPTTAPSAPDAESYLRGRLRGPRRALYDLVVRRTRTGLADRERLRFCRTRAFGSAKRMLGAIGRSLARQGLIETGEDIFLLRLAEVRAVMCGGVGHAELPGLVRLRKAQRDQDAKLRAPSRFTTAGVPYAGENLTAWHRPEAAARSVRELRGIPCAPGVAEGPAVVADAPTDVTGAVLLAYRTDPGWVPALASAAALVIERGSPLTHVAIVARELGIPTVVQVKDATTRIVTGTRLRVDGGTGLVTVLDEVTAR
jgi:rifampicin phosphotransferase